MEVPDIRIHILDTPEKAGDFLAWLKTPGREFVAVDTENTGLDWAAPDFRVRMIQFGDEKSGWAIPFQGWSALVKHALNWLAEARIWTVWFNLGYDALALRREGIQLDWSIQADLFALVVVSGFANEKRGLKDTAARELGPWAQVGQAMLDRGMNNAGWTWATVPMGWRPYPLYGVVDTVATALLWRKYLPKFIRWKAQHDLELGAVRQANNMAWRGLPVDIGYMENQIQILKAEESKLNAELKELGVSPVTDSEVRKVLEEQGAFPPDTLLTGTGMKSVAAEVLDRMSNPIAAKVKRLRWVHRAWNTYLRSMLEHTDSNGRCHMGIKTMEARTSRMSIEKPPLQQLPANDPIVRRAIVGHTRSSLVISSDYSQIELRLWASMNKDFALINAIKEADKPGSPDFFTALCRDIYKEPGFVKADHRRTQVKSTTYAKLFGGGIDVAAKTAGVETYALVPTWKLLGETYASLGDNGMSMVQRHGADIAYINSTFDRRFAVRGELDQQMRLLPNYVTQGSAAIALKTAMAGLEAAGLDDHLMLPVHDEVLASAEPSELDEIMHEMSEIMNAVIDEELWGIRVPADPHYGANWAEAKG